MKVVAIISQKGGAGKTTTAVNLAVEAASKGQRVVLVDLDSQATAANWSDRRNSDAPAVVSAQLGRLRQVLDLARKEGAVLVVLDTPPRNSETTIAAAKAADLALVPLKPLIHDVETLPALAELLKVAEKPRVCVVFNDAPIQGSRDDLAQTGAEDMGWNVCPVRLHHRSAYHDAPNAGQGVSEYEPDGKAAKEIRDLYRFVSKQVNL